MESWAEFRKRIRTCFNNLVNSPEFMQCRYSGEKFYKLLSDFTNAWDIGENYEDPTGRVCRWNVWIDSLRREILHATQNDYPEFICPEFINSIVDLTHWFLNICDADKQGNAFFFTYLFSGPECICLRWISKDDLVTDNLAIPGYFPSNTDLSRKVMTVRFAPVMVPSVGDWMKAYRLAIKKNLVVKTRRKMK